MKKFYLLFCTGIFSGPGLFAQAYLGLSDKGKTSQAAASIRLSFNDEQVESALKAYLLNKGYTSSNVHGFKVYRGVPLDSTDKEGSDLYFATSKPDRKIKDMTILTLVPAKKNQDAGSGPFVDSSRLDRARVFLDSLAPYVQVYGTGMQISDQQEGLKKAQGTMNGLLNKQEDLNKQLRELQASLDQNKIDQARAAADLQSSISGDDETKIKNQKKLNKLIDQQGHLEKKIRRTQSDLNDNKTDQQHQQEAIAQLQQGLNATKARQVQ
jgi:hypothetical protein